MPVTGRRGLYVCEILRKTHCLDNRLTDGGEAARLTHRPRSTPQKQFQFLSLVLISLEADINDRGGHPSIHESGTKFRRQVAVVSRYSSLAD
jgi:hypothetical protein